MKADVSVSLKRRVFLAASLILFFLAGYVFNGLDKLHWLDDQLVEKRMALEPRRALGNIAYIAIDKRSLDEQGVWPWPRSIHGRIVQELVKAGVKDIAFDIDFSARSTPEEDKAFASALEQAGGGVILASFLQQTAVDSHGSPLSLNYPIPELAANAWVGAVNVVPGEDGVLRTMPYGINTNEGPLQSIPAIFAGLNDPRFDSFNIDYSIRPDSVPVFSVSQLLAGKLADGALRDKSVLVGAFAVELKDYFNVPVWGNISGPMVQILAAETLAQHRTVEWQDNWATAAIAASAVLLFFLLRPKRLTLQFLLLFAIAVGVEGGAFWLFKAHAVALHTAAIHLTLALVAFSRIVFELDLRRWLHRMAKLESRNTRQILEQVITDNSDAIVIADESGKILELSVRVADVFRPTRPVVEGDPLNLVAPPRILAEVTRALELARHGESGRTDIREIDINVADGTYSIEYSITPSRLEGENGELFIVCIAARDITHRRQQEEALDRLSRYDVLTGALRQTEFVARLQSMLKARDAGAPQRRQAVSVFSLNLHRFKTINATLGREVGDELLIEVARLLETFDSGIVLVGRTGGDSFCLARFGGISNGEGERFAESLIRSLGAPFTLGDNRAKVGVHIGFATAGADEPADAAQMLDNAEFALDEARAINGSGWSRFDPAASSRITKARQVERELWRSLERNEISVSYQPQVNLTDRRLVGVEALVRWNHNTFGLVSPGDFVEIAEANGFVEKLGQWVLWRACADAMSWNAPITVAVNVSPLQFTRGDIVGDVQQALSQSGLPPHRLHLEITESAFLGQTGELVDKLNQLKKLGVSLALDDFGTGYSSFGYLAKFPLDKIKVDQMFVRKLSEDASSQAIIRSVRSLCEGLSIKMICEGVETEEQLRILQQIGCEEGQGWLFGKPQTNDVIIELTTPARANLA